MGHFMCVCVCEGRVDRPRIDARSVPHLRFFLPAKKQSWLSPRWHSESYERSRLCRYLWSGFHFSSGPKPHVEGNTTVVPSSSSSSFQRVSGIQRAFRLANTEMEISTSGDVISPLCPRCDAFVSAVIVCWKAVKQEISNTDSQTWFQLILCRYYKLKSLPLVRCVSLLGVWMLPHLSKVKVR